jgi:hypothetical protein
MVFRIARKVAKDRVISTVDPEARHGHKTQARGFDGYEGHIAVDPDSEIVTTTTVTPGNAADGSVATDLIDDLLDDGEAPSTGTTPMAPGTSSRVSRTLASTRSARPSDPPHRAGCSGRTASRSTWTTTPSPVPPACGSGSAGAPLLAERPFSATRAASARWATTARPQAMVASSVSAPTNRHSPARATASATRNGSLTTAPGGPRSIASWCTSCADVTVDDEQESVAASRSMPISGCSPPLRTWLGWPLSKCSRPSRPGRWPAVEIAPDARPADLTPPARELSR